MHTKEMIQIIRGIYIIILLLKIVFNYAQSIKITANQILKKIIIVGQNKRKNHLRP